MSEGPWIVPDGSSAPLAERVRADPRVGTCRCGARGYVAVAFADPVYRYCTRCGADWYSPDGVTIDPA